MAMFSIYIFIIGIAIGSFLNVLIDRLPNEESITGRSHCDYCRKKINWFDLIPVFSYFILVGKTRCCQKKLSFQYPFIELITGLAFLLVFRQMRTNVFQLIPVLGIIACSIVIFASDLKYHLISDHIQIAFLIFTVAYHFGGLFSVGSLTNYIVSAVVVALPIWLIYFISKEKAMGLGDVYLALNLGFLLGWESGFLALYIAFIIGAIFGLILIFIRKKNIKSKVSFGPFIIIGMVTMLFYQKEIFELIKRFYGL